MKKIAILAVMLALVTPAMAATSVTIDACSIGTTGNVAIIYNATGGDVSGFGLDVNVSTGTITAISGYHIGESKAGSKGYGIFPGTIDINDTTGNVDSYGNPVALSTDPGALGGIGTGGITLELGALYTTGNAPGRAGTLCTVTVSGTCNLKIALNTTRGGVVDVNSADATTPGLPRIRHITKVTICTVPNVVNQAEATATAAITAAGFTLGTRTTARDDTIVAGNVISTNPAAGATPACGSAVAYVVSLGPCTVPNVVDQAEATATAAITAAGFTLGTRTTSYHATIIAGNVISTNPAAGVQPCGTAVAYVVSTGTPVLSGTVTLQNLTSGREVGKVVTIQIYDVNATLVETLTPSLTSGGAYTATCVVTTPGTYDIYFKASHWLRKKVAGVVLASPTTVNASLLNGDINNSNAINITDLGLLKTDYLKTGTDPYLGGDLDESGAVNITDLGILKANYLKAGD